MAQLHDSRDGPAHPEDLRLMQLVARGDSRARNLMAMRLCDRFRRVQRGLLAESTDADDATQDALVEVIRSAGSYRGDSSLERWACRIAVRTGLRFRRKAQTTRVDPGTHPDTLLSPAYDGDGHDALPRPLHSYLGQLPEAERQALFLKHALGYTVPEIAELTQTARSTVKFRLAKGLERVRKAIRRDTTIGVHGGVA